MPKQNFITGLDVGTDSIKGLSVFKKPDSSHFEVLGLVQFPSFGLRKGVVQEVEEVSKRISQVREKLEEKTGQKIKEVLVNIDGSQITSISSHGTIVVSRADQRISGEDVNRVLQSAQAISLPYNKEILDVEPKEFIVDGQSGIKEPVDMQGMKLEAEVTFLCAFSPHLKNLTQAVLNAGLQVEDVIPSPIAAARACLTPQQKELGAVLLDIGAGTTGMAVFEEGNLIHLVVFPFGSANITHDIAVGLRTEIEIAEKIKQEFGTCILSGGETKKVEKIEVIREENSKQEKETLTFSRKLLTEIITARISEIFDAVNKELKKITPQKLLPAGVILTGGGSKLPRIVDFAKKELRLPCRLGLPSGFLDLEKDPSLATVCGLITEGAEIRGDIGFPRLGKGIASRLKRIFRSFIP